MLTITTITVKQPEESKQEVNFSKLTASGESFEWVGQGAATLKLTTTKAKSPERKV